MADEDEIDFTSLGLDPATMAFMEQYSTQQGFDQTTLSSIWGGTLDTQYPVQRTRTNQPYGRGDNAYLPGGASKGQAEEFQRRIAAGRTVERDQTAEELFTDFVKRSRVDPEDFTRIQQELFMGGFFNPSVQMEDIAFGSMDDTTLDAWYSLLQWTARYNEAGAGVTWEDVLAERSAKLLGPLREQMAKASARAGRTVSLSDPAGLAQALNQVSQQTLGRKASADEQRTFVATIHAMQSGAQSVEGGTSVAPDIGGQAEAMLRQNNAVEAQSHDVARTFDDFLGIIGGMGTA